MRKILATAGIIIISFGLTACASFKEASCGNKAAATEVAITQAYTMTKSLYDAGDIGKSQKDRIVMAIDSANAAVDSAYPLCKLDQKSAMDYLLVANHTLNQVSEIIGE